ncbi:NUDIX domain-containing protein [Micromonospora sp. NPDC048999]|uniref:NUDIX domain-containing protein n=1 Tax=Micromonospora sp. NPDC048999 TaxID=3155391 RepID=UPI00340C8F11
MTTAARVRATSYITRTGTLGPEVLVFNYPSTPVAGTHLPGGGVEPGERPDTAAIREALEETGIQGSLHLLGVVGVQQGTYDTGASRISIYFHLASDEQRDSWAHTMIGDETAWDTGLQVACRFVPIEAATELLQASGHGQEQFLETLTADGAAPSSVPPTMQHNKLTTPRFLARSASIARSPGA